MRDVPESDADYCHRGRSVWSIGGAFAWNVGRTWMSRAGWDGILPLVIVIVPTAIRALLPRQDVPEILCVILMPLAALLWRAHAGAIEIRRICDGRLPALRQCGLAIAIILLMLFEFLATITVFSPQLLWEMWPTIVGLYAMYFLTITVTLAPTRHR
ncbi:hypothetical protein [Planctomicrobium piriforme]|uniref:Uncharacterized protein n=1 Tax=Planctomicrobium piriforme TaxID=1576369 RepID=A0A1I3P7Z9_9PLAN|nr:hypothetical protein [Planctomicrobium piriforme]SFJ17460.1 hypothetical protein SAMN05421753_11661 [Planctomicrobium piriforme]